MLVLSIMHNVFLSKEEIQKLLEEKEIETVGVSVPVWYYKGNTSEPAEEVFCKYKLKITDKKESVAILKNGYVINFQNLPEDYIENTLSPEELQKMKPEDIRKWQIDNPQVANVHKLSADNGKVSFRQFGKKKQDGTPTNLVHQVEIHQMARLLQSIV